MFNIADFSSELNRSGVSKKSNYEVYLLRRQPADAEVENSLRFRCQQTELPGRSISTYDKKIYGSSWKVGYDTTFLDVTLNILLSEDLREKTYFEQWQDLIVGNYGLGTTNSKMWDIGYYDDYIADIEFKMYSETGDETFSTKAIAAFPISVGNISLDYSAGAELNILPVVITYSYLVRKK